MNRGVIKITLVEKQLLRFVERPYRAIFAMAWMNSRKIQRVMDERFSVQTPQNHKLCKKMNKSIQCGFRFRSSVGDSHYRVNGRWSRVGILATGWHLFREHVTVDTFRLLSAAKKASGRFCMKLHCIPPGQIKTSDFRLRFYAVRCWTSEKLCRPNEVLNATCSLSSFSLVPRIQTYH